MRPIVLAGMINRMLGGFAVAPWEVDDLPPEVLEPLLAMVFELPTMRHGVQEIEKAKARIRAEHAKRVH